MFTCRIANGDRSQLKKYVMLLLLSVFLFLQSSCDKDDPGNPNSVTPADFLSGDTYDKLVVEIISVSGYGPTAASLNNLQTFLSERLNKPGGISIVQGTISSPGKTSYSTVDISDVEDKNRTQHTNNKTLTAFIFFSDADYSENSGGSKVLGVAYGPSSMAVFKTTVQEFSGGITQPTETVLESTTLLHEFCHILGLVNNGTDTQSAHEDTAHGKHCTNENCLMYWLVENSDIAANLLGGNIPQLDSLCIADLQANGGK